MKDVKKGRLAGFAQRLKRARTLAELTRERFAANLGVPVPTAPPCRDCETVRRLLGIIEAMQRQGRLTFYHAR